jgi:hypothetical protein
MGRCTGWRAALALVVAPLVLVVGACGGSGESKPHASTSTSGGSSAVAAGCTAAQPRSVALSPREWLVSVRVCAARDGSSVLLKNISAVAVLQVRGAPGTMLQEQSSATKRSLADQTAAQVAAGGCPSQTACTVAPGEAVLANGSPATIDFAAAPAATVAVGAARSYATWTQEETQSGQQLAGRIVTCAKLTGDAVSGAAGWEAAFERLYRRGAFCWRLITTVMADAGTGDRPIVQVFEDIARRIDQGAWSDALRYGSAHVSAG